MRTAGSRGLPMLSRHGPWFGSAAVCSLGLCFLMGREEG